MAGRKKDWCFTIHSGHFGDKTEQAVIDGLKAMVSEYIVFQLETGGELGRDHIQGYVMFKTLKSMQQVKNALPCDAHLEHRQAPKISDAVKYCKKDDTRRPGTMWWESGVMPMDQGVKRTLTEACELAKTKGFKHAFLAMPDVVVRHARGIREYAHIAAGERIPQQRPVKVYYVWGDSGCGKSWWANTLFDSPMNTYTTTDMPDKIWMGNYSGERTLVIEEFESLCNHSILKCMLEGYKMEFQTKGGFVWSEWDVVILTSNVDPRVAYDAKINWWSVLPTPPGPFQRRFSTGGIHHGTGNWEMGTSAFDVPLPVRAPDPAPVQDPVDVAYDAAEAMPNAGLVAPDSGAAPDDAMVDLTLVPGGAFEPTTPMLIAALTLDVDDFLNF